MYSAVIVYGLELQILYTADVRFYDLSLRCILFAYLGDKEPVEQENKVVFYS